MEAKLNLENWDSLLGSFQPLDLDFQMPLFTHRSLVDLNETLIGLGVEDAFHKENADFRGINGGLDLRLSSFMQLTEFHVDQGLIKRGTTRRDLSKQDDPVWGLFQQREARQAQGT